MDKVIETKEQFSQSCNLLAPEGAMTYFLLPVVLGNAGDFFNALIVQQRNRYSQFKNSKTIQQASPTRHTQSTKPGVSTTIPEKAKLSLRSKGKEKRQTASLFTSLCP
jgi:hypothetical protein